MVQSLLAAVVFGGTGIVLSIIGYKLFDAIETKVDFATEIKNGNSAAAVVIGSFIVGICIIVGRAIGS